jgi:thymidylate kinase
MIIAFMGNDGSGKTTISRQIHKFFADLGFETIYKHEYEYAILRFLFKLIGKKKLEKSRNEMMVQKKRSVSYTLWPILVWFDLLMQYVYYRIFKRRSVILLDRYPYDQYLSFKYLGTITKFTEWLYLHFPKPDMHLVLTVSPEIAYDRKKNTHSYSISFYKQSSR